MKTPGKHSTSLRHACALLLRDATVCQAPPFSPRRPGARGDPVPPGRRSPLIQLGDMEPHAFSRGGLPTPDCLCWWRRRCFLGAALAGRDGLSEGRGSLGLRDSMRSVVTEVLREPFAPRVACPPCCDRLPAPPPDSRPLPPLLIWSWEFAAGCPSAAVWFLISWDIGACWESARGGHAPPRTPEPPGEGK